MSQRVVTCQTCGGLSGLKETCEACDHRGTFVVNDELGEDPNRYGPGGAIGPRPPAPGLWVTATAPEPEEPESRRSFIVAASASGAHAVEAKKTSDLYME